MRRTRLPTVGRMLAPLGLAVAVAMLAACGANSSAPDGSSASVAETSSPAEVSPSMEEPEDLPVPSESPSGDKPPRRISVSGTVEDGVEAGCKLLGQYLLLGAATAELRAGDAVTVTGIERANIVSMCQQGLPLEVLSVSPAG